MGLSLGVREGSRIIIDQSELVVMSVSSTLCQVAIGASKGRAGKIGKFDIVATERVEILPGVFCQLGKVDEHGGQSYTRLVFEAPRSIAIERVKGT